MGEIRRQRVVSLVSEGGPEEEGLISMFFEVKKSSTPSGEHDEAAAEGHEDRDARWRLEEWDLASLKAAMMAN